MSTSPIAARGCAPDKTPSRWEFSRGRDGIVVAVRWTGSMAPSPKAGVVNRKPPQYLGMMALTGQSSFSVGVHHDGCTPASETRWAAGCRTARRAAVAGRPPQWSCDKPPPARQRTRPGGLQRFNVGTYGPAAWTGATPGPVPKEIVPLAVTAKVPMTTLDRLMADWSRLDLV